MGQAICWEYAAHGARVVVLDRDAAGAAQTAERVRSLGADCLPLTADVAEANAVRGAVERAAREFGGVDFLVNTAGVSEFRPAAEVGDEQWQRTIAINLGGAWNLSRAVAPHMIARRFGKIVHIGSAAGMLAIPLNAPYTASKHGLIGLTRALAVDLGPHQINVNCICPSTVVTPLLRQATTPAFQSAMRQRIPLRRLGELADVVHAVLFLTSSLSAWISGAVLPVDGGLTCCIRSEHPE
jgi:NAD(P)-dependent dehydrogenase (short-subunit alcohol dehydrogenase family)